MVMGMGHHCRILLEIPPGEVTIALSVVGKTIVDLLVGWSEKLRLRIGGVVQLDLFLLEDALTRESRGGGWRLRLVWWGRWRGRWWALLFLVFVGDQDWVGDRLPDDLAFVVVQEKDDPDVSLAYIQKQGPWVKVSPETLVFVVVTGVTAYPHWDVYGDSAFFHRRHWLRRLLRLLVLLLLLIPLTLDLRA